MKLFSKRIMLILLFMALVLTGCTTGSSFLAQNVTSVELSRSNFNIVARNVQGSSQAGYLIGISTSVGQTTNTLALFRVAGTARLYDEAIQDLWKNFEDNYGAVGDRSLVLTNFRYDSDILNLLVYTKTTQYIIADVIEFTD